MNCAPITIIEAKNNGGFDLLLDLKGLSFIGLSGGGVTNTKAKPTTIAPLYQKGSQSTNLLVALLLDFVYILTGGPPKTPTKNNSSSTPPS
jgi:hypothetical protein